MTHDTIGATVVPEGMPDAVSKRLLRGLLPLAVALAAMPGCLLPAVADAASLSSMPATAAPDRAAEWWLAALGAQRTPLPQGPVPGGMKMRNVQRTVRRRG